MDSQEPITIGEKLALMKDEVDLLKGEIDLGTAIQKELAAALIKAGNLLKRSICEPEQL